MGLVRKDPNGGTINSDSTYGKVLRAMFLIIGNDANGVATVTGIRDQFDNLNGRERWGHKQMVMFLHDMEIRGLVEHGKPGSDTFWRFTSRGLAMALDFKHWHQGDAMDQVRLQDKDVEDRGEWESLDDQINALMADADGKGGYKLADIVKALSVACDAHAEALPPQYRQDAAKWTRAAGMLEMLSVKLRRM